MARRGLTPQQRKFCAEYVKDSNGTRAAIAAGYSGRSAYSTASGLLNRSEISREIDRLCGRIVHRSELKEAEVITELRRILLADPRDAIGEDGIVKPIEEWPEDLRRALGGMDVKEEWNLVPVVNPDTGEEEIRREQTGRVVKIRFISKTAASDQLLKKLGSYKPEVVEHRHSFADLVLAADAEDSDE